MCALCSPFFLFLEPLDLTSLCQYSYSGSHRSHKKLSRFLPSRLVPPLSVMSAFIQNFFFLSFLHVCSTRTHSGIISCRDTRRRCMKAKAPLRSCQIIFSNSLFLLSQQVIPAEEKWNVCVREHLAAVGVGVSASSVSLPSLY